MKTSTERIDVGAVRIRLRSAIKSRLVTRSEVRDRAEVGAAHFSRFCGDSAADSNFSEQYAQAIAIALDNVIAGKEAAIKKSRKADNG